MVNILIIIFLLLASILAFMKYISRTPWGSTESRFRTAEKWRSHSPLIQKRRNIDLITFREINISIGIKHSINTQIDLRLVDDRWWVLGILFQIF
jgi:hypothetical protein